MCYFCENKGSSLLQVSSSAMKAHNSLQPLDKSGLGKHIPHTLFKQNLPPRINFSDIS